MPRRSFYFRRLAGAISSRVIPVGSVCRLCGKPATHVVLSAVARNYACAPHAEQGIRLGYEVFEGHPPKEKADELAQVRRLPR